jgi:hypothetical protein
MVKDKQPGVPGSQLLLHAAQHYGSAQSSSCWSMGHNLAGMHTRQCLQQCVRGVSGL